MKSYFYKSLITSRGRFLNTLFSASTIMEAVRGYYLSPLLRLQIQESYCCEAGIGQQAQALAYTQGRRDSLEEKA